MKPKHLFDLLEPEEFVGGIWHNLLGKAGRKAAFPEAAVSLEEMRRVLTVVFRGLGGAPELGLAATGARSVSHRPGLRERIAGKRPVVSAHCDEQTLYLPAVIDAWPEAGDNRGLYLWLAAFFAYLPPRLPEADNIRYDIAYLRDVRAATEAALRAAPGLRGVHRRLCASVLKERPVRKLPAAEAAVEWAVRALLGEEAENFDAFCEEALLARQGLYHTFLPVSLWGRTSASPAGFMPEAEETASEQPAKAVGGGARKASRKQHDETERQDYLALNRFEKMPTLSESLNLARPVEDDEAELAKQAVEDSPEIVLSKHRKSAATRLKVELELAPPDASGAALAGGALYPEWDWRKRGYRADYCRVIVSRPDTADVSWQPGPDMQRRIRQIRHQFEALAAQNITLHAQTDGDEIDLEALVRSRADLKAGGLVCDRTYTTTLRRKRDLAVALLVDASLSTDSWVEGRRVIDLERDASLMFCQALDALGDDHAVFSFTSRGRREVRFDVLKGFDEKLSAAVTRRIGALKPGYYTRLGAAMRHAAAEISLRPATQKLLLVLTDGKPNDIDHYEGRFGLEDARRAALEAHHAGIQVFGLTIDRRAQAYFPVLFGQGGFSIVSDPARLPVAVTKLIRRMKAR